MYEDQREKWRRFLAREIKYEAALENYMVEGVHDAGGLALKMDPRGNAGVPDLMILFKGNVFFVELKTERGTVQPHQKAKHRLFDLHGHPVHILRGKEQVDYFIEQYLPE